jgi:hypothetical protein
MVTGSVLWCIFKLRKDILTRICGAVHCSDMGCNLSRYIMVFSQSWWASGMLASHQFRRSFYTTLGLFSAQKYIRRSTISCSRLSAIVVKLSQLFVKLDWDTYPGIWREIRQHQRGPWAAHLYSKVQSTVGFIRLRAGVSGLLKLHSVY